MALETLTRPAPGDVTAAFAPRFPSGPFHLRPSLGIPHVVSRPGAPTPGLSGKSDRMSYIECPGCGRKVLSVATRCPTCGRPADPKPFNYTPPRSNNWGIPVALLVGVVGVALAVVVIDRVRRSRGALPQVVATPPERVEQAITIDTPRVAPADGLVDSVLASDTLPDSAAVTPPAGPTPVAVTPPPPPPPALPARAPLPPGSTVTAPAPLPAGVARRRVNTTVNMRADRSPGAPVVQVLLQGQEVLSDSLSQGWYRVLLDGVNGYVDRRFLDDITAP